MTGNLRFAAPEVFAARSGLSLRLLYHIGKTDISPPFDLARLLALVD